MKMSMNVDLPPTHATGMNRNVAHDKTLLNYISPDVIEVLTIVREFVSVMIALDQNLPAMETWNTPL